MSGARQGTSNKNAQSGYKPTVRGMVFDDDIKRRKPIEYIITSGGCWHSEDECERHGKEREE